MAKQSLNARPTLQFRAPQSELDSYKRAADAVGMTVSEWARTVLRREAGLWTGGQAMTTTIKTTAIECADEAWAVLLQGATVSRIDGETMSDNGTETRSVTAWEPMQGDWEALDEMLGHKATRDERAAFEVEYVDRLWSLIKAVD